MEIRIMYVSLVIFFIVGSFVEYYITSETRPQYYNLKDVLTSVKLMFTGLAMDALIKIMALMLLLQIVPYAFFTLEYTWTTWLACFVVWDFIFYWMHYLEHHVRLFWATHVNHHSSRYMNLSTSLRSGIFKGFYRYFFIVPIFFIGFPLPMFLVIYGLGKLWAFFSHSQLLGNWGVFEYVLVTPTHHRVHHSCNDNHLDKNFGETLIIWDRLFGTFQPEDKTLTYGIHEHVDESRFGHVVLHEFQQIWLDFKRTSSWRHKLHYVLGKPGWQPKKTTSSEVLDVL